MLIVAVTGLVALAAACAPAEALLRVTVRDSAGNTLAGLVVTVRDRTASTDASGVAVLSGLKPGPAEIRVTGEGYQGTRSENLKAGDNRVDITLTPPSLALEGLQGLPSLRLRFTASAQGKIETTECAIVRGAGSHWKIPGQAEFIALGDAFYVNPDGKWQRLQSGAFMASFLTVVADGFLVGYQGFLESALGPDIQVRQMGTGTANGFACRTYELSGPSAGEWVRATVHVISSGTYAGYATRTYWENSKGDSLTTDLFDMGGAITIKAPL